jgi:hypothetical protein
MPLIPTIAFPFWSTWNSSTSSGGSVTYRLDTNTTALAALAGYKNDARAQLQAFIDGCVSASAIAVISQQYGMTLGSGNICLNVPSNGNTRIIFAPGASLRLGTHSAPDYSMMYLGGSGYFIEGAVLDGAKEINGMAPGGANNEFGMGFYLDEASNVTLVRPKVINTWGDGYYIGGSTYCSNVKLYEPYSAGVRRNGMSVIGVSGMEVYCPTFTYTQDTNPKAGLDFEPNNNANRLRAINIYGMKTIANNLGLEFALSGLLGATPQSLSINIYDWTDIRSLDTALNRYDLSPSAGQSISGTIVLNTIKYVKPNIQYDMSYSFTSAVSFTKTNETLIS